MLFPTTRHRHCLLAIWLGLLPGLGLAQARKPMPTASLPLEPASADIEGVDEQKPTTSQPEHQDFSAMRARTPRTAGGHEASVQGGLLMSRDGFGAQLRLLEFASSWLAVTQTLRYQSQEGEEALFDKQYGLMLGLEAHPWRTAWLSPQIVLQAGGDRYLRGLNQEELDLFGLEAAAGIELKLMRAASFLFQWTEVFYPGLKEQLFIDQKPRVQYAGSFQVFFNLRWDGVL